MVKSVISVKVINSVYFLGALAAANISPSALPEKGMLHLFHLFCFIAVVSVTYFVSEEYSIYKLILYF